LFLRAQFDSCRIALVCRSKLDERIVLIRWSLGAFNASDPVTDRGRRPNVAYYVLDSCGDEHLVPIASSSDLADQYPDHFESGLIPVRRSRLGCLGAAICVLGIVGLWRMVSSFGVILLHGEHVIPVVPHSDSDRSVG